MTKTILAFGDSLTFGARADGPTRHDKADRWPVALQQALGPDYDVIAEGLNGRTTVFGDPQAVHLRAGCDVLPTLLHSHQPLDLVVIMLGTNDVMVAEKSSRAATRGMARLVEIIRHHPYWGGAPVPRILVVAPPACIADAAGQNTPRDVAETAKLAAGYATVAQENGCSFFDAGSVAKAALPDGVHLDADGSRAIGAALAPVVQTIIAR